MDKSNPTEQLIFFSLEKTSKVIREKLNAYLKFHNTNLTSSQWICLEAIYHKPGLKQKALSNLLYKEEASISRIVKKLLDKGFIIRKKLLSDNKTQRLYASPIAIETLKSHQQSIKRIYKEIFKNVYDREMNLVHDVLKRVHSN